MFPNEDMKLIMLTGPPQKKYLTNLVLLVLVSWVTSADPLSAQENNRNSDRHTTPAVAPIDTAVREFMALTGATAATVAIGRNGRIVYSQGYGFSDRRGQIPVTPRTTMRLASCTKPFTAVAVQKLIDQKTISPETKVYEFLGIRPADELADERVRTITIQQLLDHRGGWDRDRTFDPMYQIADIKKSLRTRRMQKQHIVRYMWGQPLQFDPGSERHYSNFGYLLLGLVIEKATDKSYIDAIRQLVAEPSGIDNLSISSEVRRHRKSREVFYRNENQLNLHLRDSASGLTTNSESLCKFMNAYWLDGPSRESRRNKYFFQFGSHPFTTSTIMEQRLDRIDYAIMLNSRREDHYEEDNNAFRDRFNRLIDELHDRLTEDQAPRP